MMSVIQPRGPHEDGLRFSTVSYTVPAH